MDNFNQAVIKKSTDIIEELTLIIKVLKRRIKYLETGNDAYIISKEEAQQAYNKFKYLSHVRSTINYQ